MYCLSCAVIVSNENKQKICLNYKFNRFTGCYLKWKFDGYDTLEELKINGSYVGGQFTFLFF